eukprot:768431-Hanusia_phi.AAC.9
MGRAELKQEEDAIRQLIRSDELDEVLSVAQWISVARAAVIAAARQGVGGALGAGERCVDFNHAAQAQHMNSHAMPARDKEASMREKRVWGNCRKGYSNKKLSCSNPTMIILPS